MHLSPMTTLQVSEVTRKITTISGTGNKENSLPGHRGGDVGRRRGVHVGKIGTGMLHLCSWGLKGNFQVGL